MGTDNMRRSREVAVLLGGPSEEREVSLKSGEAVVAALRRTGHIVHAVDVTAARLPPLPAGIEAAFIALHGRYGEDGGVQAELAALGIPYTGCDARASRLAFDKLLAKQEAQRLGIPTAPFAVVAPGAPPPLPFPLVVKPLDQGSSIGVHRVDRPADWSAALADAAGSAERALAERYVPGRELTVGVLDEWVLPALEIEAPGGWYDFQAKFTRGACRFTVPAPLEPDVAAAAGALARRAFDGLGCRGVARIDFRLDPEGGLWLLELNTIPGFAEASLLPMAAAAAGLTFEALCERLLERAAL